MKCRVAQLGIKRIDQGQADQREIRRVCAHMRECGPCREEQIVDFWLEVAREIEAAWDTVAAETEMQVVEQTA